MAATAEAARLTEAHHLAQSRLAARLTGQLADTWALLDPTALDAPTPPWLRVPAPVIENARSAPAVLAGDYMSTFRALEVGPLNGFTPRLAGALERRSAVGSLLVT